MKIRTILFVALSAVMSLWCNHLRATITQHGPLAEEQGIDTTFTSIDWEYEVIMTDSTGLYYLFNLGERLFLNDDNTLGCKAKTLWTIHGTDISSEQGRYLSLTSQNKGSLLQPNWVFMASSDRDEPATSVLQSHEDSYYVIGNNVNVSLLFKQNRYLAADGATLVATPGQEPTEQAQWIFISTEQFAEKTADIDIDSWERTQAIADLAQAIADAELFQASLTVAPQACKLSLQTAISAAKAMKSTLDMGGMLARLISTQRIIDTTNSLLDTLTQLQGISDYYQGAQAEIDAAAEISTSAALKALITTARGGLELSSNSSGIKRTLNTLHTGLMGYMQLVDSLNVETNVTGMILNHSFDRGCMDEWLSLNIDANKIDITNISLDNLSSLAGAISLGLREGTRAVENMAEDSIADVDGRYYMYSDNEGTLPGQPVAQMVLGLPAGSYQLSARMAVNPGFLNTNACHLAVFTVSAEALKEVVRDIDFTSPDLDSMLDSLDLASKLPMLMQNSHLATGRAVSPDINTWADVSLTFDIEKNDLVLFTLNGGMFPLIGSSAYRADHVQMTYLHAPVAEDDPTDIRDIRMTDRNGQVYDLSGCMTDKHRKGIMIRGGRKYLNR